MSHVDTSIGFSLRSEPPAFAAPLTASKLDLPRFAGGELHRRCKMFMPVMVGVLVAQVLGEFIFEPYKSVFDSIGKNVVRIVVFAMMIGLAVLIVKLGISRTMGRIQTAGFDSPLIHLTSEGKYVVFRFASGLEFTERWDRLLRFKTTPEYTEFEFPADPPIIVPTSAFPEETLATITAFINQLVALNNSRKSCIFSNL